MLTISESRFISEQNPSVQNRIYGILQGLEENELITREDLDKFDIHQVEDTDMVNIGIRRKTGALRQSLHVIIGPRGGLKHAEKDGRDLLEKDYSINIVWSSINKFTEDML